MISPLKCDHRKDNKNEKPNGAEKADSRIDLKLVIRHILLFRFFPNKDFPSFLSEQFLLIKIDFYFI
jgi:hypothetical protein